MRNTGANEAEPNSSHRYANAIGRASNSIIEGKNHREHSASPAAPHAAAETKTKSGSRMGWPHEQINRNGIASELPNSAARQENAPTEGAITKACTSAIRVAQCNGPGPGTASSANNSAPSHATRSSAEFAARRGSGESIVAFRATAILSHTARRTARRSVGPSGRPCAPARRARS